MIHTAKQLKDLIRNMSQKTGVKPEVLFRKYMMERFLERISLSEYNERFILKGGMLIVGVMGIEARTTMDMDTTVKGIPVTMDNMERIITEISNIALEDNVKFRIKRASVIMEEAEYPGVRFSMDAELDGTVIPMKMDVSTGDVITPKEISYSYKLMFEDRTIPIMAYPIETVLAEKLHAVISKGTAGTRMRDFYDIDMLLKSQNVDDSVFALALERTAKNKGGLNFLAEAGKILKEIKSDEKMKSLWATYQENFIYASKYSWDDVVHSVWKLSIKAKLDVSELYATKSKANAEKERDENELER